MTKLKICGLREAGHALAAGEAGADYLGFNFVHGVRRQLSEEAGQRVIEEYRRLAGPGGPRIVGLFANQPLDEVNRIIGACRLEFAQLCGDETPDFWRRVDAEVIRQIKVRDAGPKQSVIREVERLLEEVSSGGHTAMLDKHEEGSLGGTGRTFDWQIARELSRKHDFLLAGGLSPDNVEAAIDTVTPWGVDVSSGVETDGVKDSAKIIDFAHRVKRFSESTG